MEHLEMPSGQLVFAGQRAPSAEMYAFEFGRTKARGELALSAAKQREQRMLNATVSLSPGTGEEEAKGTFQRMTPEVLEEYRRWDEGGRVGRRPAARPPAKADTAVGPPRVFNLMTRQEQAPNPASRVTLGRERDALGMPRVTLDWRLTPLDRRSFRAFYEVLGRELGRSGVGRVRMNEWVTSTDPAWPASLGGGWHHMGTTRMHDDPKQGVVDANCRMHGVGNLSIAGASVYPTGGCANPTLTLVALSLRLSDRLRTVLG
jgi:choline dehydrogenase-like flavoprotein